MSMTRKTCNFGRRYRFAFRRPGGGGDTLLLQHRRSRRKNGDRDPSRCRRSIRDRVGRRLRPHACDVNHQRDLHRPPARRRGDRRRGRRRDLPRVSAGLGCRPNKRAADFSTPQVPTRVNSPSDVAFEERDSRQRPNFHDQRAGRRFTALNSVQPGGIHPSRRFRPAATVRSRARRCSFDVTFTTPFLLPADHYFFVPQVQLARRRLPCGCRRRGRSWPAPGLSRRVHRPAKLDPR